MSYYEEPDEGAYPECEVCGSVVAWCESCKRTSCDCSPCECEIRQDVERESAADHVRGLR